MNQNIFSTPIVLFLYKRLDTVVQIIDRIRSIKPSKLYILSDGPKNDEETLIVDNIRNSVERLIDWECEVIKKYSPINIGVYENIGEGAKWVLSHEKEAIFIEDDNLPEISFFFFCKELLNKYSDEEKVLWICGTNYLEDKFKPIDSSSYLFSQHLMPCGWASWSHKFIKYYDGKIETVLNKESLRLIRKNYKNKSLFRYQLRNVVDERKDQLRGKRIKSWDHQLALSIRLHNLYGIVPCVNLIKNIGVDDVSEHGGTTFNNIMTQRFCGIETQQLKFPLKHPNVVEKNDIYEKKVDNIILPPCTLRVKKDIIFATKYILKVIIGEKMLNRILVFKRKLFTKNKVNKKN
ncbi:MAG TPA: glycosyltransferase family 2 protein [Bacilli bacterium]|nr:glycosyltransferase family 2 protein [Bacilli bacterium]